MAERGSHSRLLPMDARAAPSRSWTLKGSRTVPVARPRRGPARRLSLLKTQPCIPCAIEQLVHQCGGGEADSLSDTASPNATLPVPETNANTFSPGRDSSGPAPAPGVCSPTGSRGTHLAALMRRSVGSTTPAAEAEPVARTSSPSWAHCRATLSYSRKKVGRRRALRWASSNRVGLAINPQQRQVIGCGGRSRGGPARYCARSRWGASRRHRTRCLTASNPIAPRHGARIVVELKVFERLHVQPRLQQAPRGETRRQLPPGQRRP